MLGVNRCCIAGQFLKVFLAGAQKRCGIVRSLIIMRVESNLLDADGYRLNIGIVIANGRGDVLWARRVRQGGWQFPQGGINEGESHEQAMYRELEEETGLTKNQVEVWAVTRDWLRYRLPKKMIRPTSGQECIGQKQKWYLLRLTADESAIHFNGSDKPEFDHWEWVSYWYPLNQIIDFKRQVYQRMLKELSSVHAQKVARYLNGDR